MYTYILSNEQVLAYLRDYANRFIIPALIANPQNTKTAFVVIGGSGLDLFKVLPPIINDSLLYSKQFSVLESFASAGVINAIYDKTTQGVAFRRVDGSFFAPNEQDNDKHVADVLKNRNVIVIDSSVHSGRSMLTVVNAIVDKYSPASISSYALFLKRSSIFIPNFYGIRINETDRALFLLDQIPNHRFISNDTVRKIDATRDGKQKHGTVPFNLDYLLRRESDPTFTNFKTFVVESHAGDLRACLSYYEEQISDTFADKHDRLELKNENAIVIALIATHSNECDKKLLGGLRRLAEASARSLDKKYIIVDIIMTFKNALWWQKKGYDLLTDKTSGVVEYALKKIY